MKRDGDKGSPYLSPCLHFIHLPGFPFNIMVTEAEDTILQIQSIHFVEKPLTRSTLNKNSRFILSTTFSKFILQRIPFYLDLLQKANISCSLSNHSVKLQPLMNANYDESINTGRNFASLNDKIFAMITIRKRTISDG